MTVPFVPTAGPAQMPSVEPQETNDVPGGKAKVMRGCCARSGPKLRASIIYVMFCPEPTGSGVSVMLRICISDAGGWGGLRDAKIMVSARFKSFSTDSDVCVLTTYASGEPPETPTTGKVLWLPSP